jgi:hypothetical protein
MMKDYDNRRTNVSQARNTGYQNNQHSSARHSDAQSDDKDELERDTWDPTDAQYAAFAKRDAEMALQNVRHSLLNYGRPVTLRECKEASLHSIDCVERTLTSMIASGIVSEAKGRYSLVRA